VRKPLIVTLTLIVVLTFLVLILFKSHDVVRTSQDVKAVEKPPKTLPHPIEQFTQAEKPSHKRVSRKRKNPEDEIFEDSDSGSRSIASQEDADGSDHLSDIDWVFRDKKEEVSKTEAITSVNRYAHALLDFERGRGARSLQLLYRIGMRASQDLTYVVAHIDEPTFQRIKKDMRGFNLNRERLFNVYPKIAFFRDLAEQKGGEGDRLFFEAMEHYLVSGGDLPRHSKRLNELVVCINYGAGLIVSDFALWSGYKVKFPKLYDYEVNEKLAEVSNALTEENCACGSKQEVFSEFKKFIDKFPTTELASRIKTRMSAIDRAPAEFRFNCKSRSDARL
jgi:hypothetical protein